MIVVSNTTPIISLASIGKIDLLKKLFDNIYIPRAVYDEIKSKDSFGFDEIDDKFFIVKEVKDKLAVDILLNDLDLGETQTIVLAKELNADIVLIDENIGYKIASSQDLTVKRTLSLIIASKNKGYIDTVKPILDDMISKKRWISRNVYFEVLKICDED
jgi:predicted nucleic acid-binding protein